MDPKVPRRMWRLFEPVHAAVYFAPEAQEEFSAVGLKGFWMGYFGGRSAAMGPVAPAVVGATFFNFAPAMVERAIPDAWRLATPDRILEARLNAARRALARLFEASSDSGALGRAAELARRSAQALTTAGRPLGAAWSSLQWPHDDIGALWHAATILREHRGDGHVAALVAAGLDGCQAHVSLSATGAVPAKTLQEARGWTDSDFKAAGAALAERGWIDADGKLTTEGLRRRRAIEELTDRMAEEPWRKLGEQQTEELAALLKPLARAAMGPGGVPVPNPMGLPAPSDH